MPPKLVQPVQVNTFSFEQVLSNKLHCTLVIKPAASKKVLRVTGSSALINPRQSMRHFTPDKTPDAKMQVASLLCDNEKRTDDSVKKNHHPPGSMKEKKHILPAYQDKFREGHPDSIITKKKGKTADEILLTCICLRPSLDKLYQVSNLYLQNFHHHSNQGA